MSLRQSARILAAVTPTPWQQPLSHKLADALGDAIDLLEELLPADHAALVRMQEVQAEAERVFARQVKGIERV